LTWHGTCLIPLAALFACFPFISSSEITSIEILFSAKTIVFQWFEGDSQKNFKKGEKNR
jgi:hypothetical protein